jgi:hypothetical protein
MCCDARPGEPTQEVQALRTILTALAVYNGANGIIMLAAPQWWYATVPGVVETGPANIHFIRDIGLAFLAAAVALVLSARPGAGRMLLLPAAVFLGGHAAYHLVEMAVDGTTAAAGIRDLLLIVVPGIIPALALVDRPRRAKEA